ncbi:MAG: hypothetical protein WAM58_08065 [Candidatus Acidiferrum sp.]
MLSFFRYLLNLYPASYRREYGEEMLGVLIEVHSEVKEKSSPARAISYAREAGGLLRGALREHARTIFFPQGFPVYPQRRLTMRSEYKFPKATIGLMTVILAAVMLAIEKAKAISESVPPSSTFVGPIQPMHFSIVAALELLAALCVGGALVWAALFAMHRSGTQRFSDLNLTANPRPNNPHL